MSGLFGSSSNAQTEPALASIKIQTSLAGLAVGVFYGRCRTSVNLLWFGDFKSRQVEESAETGKGGGGTVRTSYQYSASVMMALGEGVVNAVRTAWVGKAKYTAITAGTKTLSTSELWTIPATGPYTVTVSQAATFAGNMDVIIPGDPLNSGDIPLNLNVDYSVSSGGVYTFNASRAAQQVRITYTYTSAYDAQSVLAQLGAGLQKGYPEQGVWSYLTSNFAAEALGYSGIAYVYAQDYALDNSAQVPNHAFEIDGALQFSPTVPDADPAEIIRDILTNPRYGIGFPAVNLDSLTQFSNFCVASNLLFSPAYSSQRPGRDVVQDLLDATNSIACWTGEKLRLVPRGDKAVSGNGRSYVPNTTVVVSITADDAAPGSPNMIEVTRQDELQLWNRVRVQFRDRAKDYNTDVVPAEDSASIISTGLRAEDPMAWDFICDGAVANAAAWLRVQYIQSARARYKTTVNWRYLQLELGDLVQLVDDKAFLSEVAMVVAITEKEDDSFEIEAEQFPIGMMNAPLIAPQLNSGFKQNYNTDPGDVTPPVIFEPPGSSVSTGLAVWVAVSGSSPYWGGCEIYASLDGGSSYKRLARLEQGSRYGSLQTAMAQGGLAVADVGLFGRGGQLLSVSPEDADSLATLCWVGPSATGEFLAYEHATLTSSNRYTLDTLRRARYGTTDAGHAAGAPFVYIDGSIVDSGPLPLAMIGKTIKFKFCSYNVFGQALQSLASAPVYEYQITGRFVNVGGPPLTHNLLQDATFAAGTGQWKVVASGPTAANFGFAKPVDGSVIPGSPSNARIYRVGAQEAGIYLAAYSPITSVKGGQRHIIQADLLPTNGQARLQAVFRDAAGGDLLWVVSDPMNPDPAYWDPRNPKHYRTHCVFADVPDAAVSGVIFALAYPASSGTVSSVDLHKPLLGVALPEQQGPSLWSPGGQNSVSTVNVEANAITETYVATAAIADVVVTGTPYSSDVECLRFTPPTSGKLDILVAATVVGQASSTGYIIEGGLTVSGTDAVSKIDGVTLVPVGTLGDLLMVPASDFNIAPVVLTITVNAVAGREIVVRAGIGRRTRVVVKVVPPPTPPAGTDKLTGITARAILKKR